MLRAAAELLRRDGLSSWRIIFFVAAGMVSGKCSANFVYDGGGKIKVFNEFTNLDSLVAFLEIVSSHGGSDAPSCVEIYCSNHNEMTRREGAS